MTSTIVRRPVVTDPGLLPDELAPVLRRVYAGRRIRSADELEYTLDRLQPPQRLGGLDAAVDLLAGLVTGGQRLLVVGDFDADGATSCALCIQALRSMGLHDVRYLVPNRFEYGYGLTPEIVEVAARERPALILTVDNGISSVAGVAAARAHGIPVLVTDHHLPGAELPAAAAIVNPNLPGDPFPSKHLAGVGVAFYLMLALRTELRRRGWFAGHRIPEPNLGRLLDLVALGTVADVVPLDHNNRILVAQGLQRIRTGRGNPGIRALLEVGRRSPGRCSAADLGFVVGPRLNAAGRLDDMSLGIECLLAGQEPEAGRMAAQLDALNLERREIESGMQAQALDIIRKLHLDATQLPTGLCLFDPAWHQGVVGILASRIKERFCRPVIAFARSENGDLKGSARSVAGLHIRDVLDTVATQHPGLISRFGGHAMAAGLSLEESGFATFADAFDREVRRQLAPEQLENVIYSDGELCAEELDIDTARLLRAAGPWGQGFPEPLFDGRFVVLEQRVVGGTHLKLRLCPLDGTVPVDAIAFHTPPLPADPGDVHMAYRLDVNEFRGVESVQLVVEHIATGAT